MHYGTYSYYRLGGFSSVLLVAGTFDACGLAALKASSLPSMLVPVLGPAFGESALNCVLVSEFVMLAFPFRSSAFVSVVGLLVESAKSSF